MNYAKHAIGAITNQLKQEDENRVNARVHQSQIMLHNLSVLAGFKDYEMISPATAICQCYGCRNRISPTASNNCNVGTARELIKNGKLFCCHCQEYKRSLSFHKLLECFPRNFIDGKDKTDCNRLPQDAFKKATKWLDENIINSNCTQSLYMFGDTGAGKSRIATLLALKALEYGITLNCIRGGGFAEKLREYSETNNREGECRWLNNLKGREVLIFDDFGRDKLTETMENKLWSILDARLGNKTTIFLSNFLPAQLPKEFDESIKRRLRDYCEFIEVKQS